MISAFTVWLTRKDSSVEQDQAKTMDAQANKAIQEEMLRPFFRNLHQDGFFETRRKLRNHCSQDVALDKSDIALTARSGRHAIKHRLTTWF
jgi:2-isopropylmalate synthase